MAQDNIEELDLLYTRSKRRELIDALTAGGKMPTDIKEQSIMLQALDGMDRSSLGKLKIKSDEGISNTQAAAANMLATLFNDSRLKTLGNDGAGSIPVLNADVVPTRIIEGELGSNKTETFSTFTTRLGME